MSNSKKASTQAQKVVVVRSVAVNGFPLAPGTEITEEEAGVSWAKWLASGAIEVAGEEAEAEGGE